MKRHLIIMIYASMLFLRLDAMQVECFSPLCYWVYDAGVEIPLITQNARNQLIQYIIEQKMHKFPHPETHEASLMLKQHPENVTTVTLKLLDFRKSLYPHIDKNQYLPDHVYLTSPDNTQNHYANLHWIKQDGEETEIWVNIPPKQVQKILGIPEIK